MRKFLALTLVIFCLLGLGMAYAQDYTVCFYCDRGFIEVTYVEPTCIDDGYRIYDCTNCSYKDEKKLPALGHNYQLESDGYYRCTRCGQVGWLY